MKRRLSSEDAALWKSVTGSIKPLRKHMPEAANSVPPDDAPKPPKPQRVKSAAAGDAPAAMRLKEPPAPPLAPIDRRTRKNIARGKHDIDGRIDLHGYRQAEAHGALLRFLQGLQAQGGRVALVITGKGGGSGGGSGDSEARGVLRRQVPHWLALPEFRDYVVGFDVATAGHGGDGALYVRLRRKRGR